MQNYCFFSFFCSFFVAIKCMSQKRFTRLYIWILFIHNLILHRQKGWVFFFDAQFLYYIFVSLFSDNIWYEDWFWWKYIKIFLFVDLSEYHLSLTKVFFASVNILFRYFLIGGSIIVFVDFYLESNDKWKISFLKELFSILLCLSVCIYIFIYLSLHSFLILF